MASNDKAIPLASLSIQELSMIKQRTEEDIANFTESINALSEVIERFMLSRDSLEILRPENKGKAVLIPITSSVTSKTIKNFNVFTFYVVYCMLFFSFFFCICLPNLLLLFFVRICLFYFITAVSNFFFQFLFSCTFLGLWRTVTR